MNDVCPNVTNGARMDRIVATKAARSGSTADEVYAEFASQTALGRFVDEIDVAEAVLFLASDRAKNITGHDIVVDAGWDVRVDQRVRSKHAHHRGQSVRAALPGS